MTSYKGYLEPGMLDNVYTSTNHLSLLFKTVIHEYFRITAENDRPTICLQRYMIPGKRDFDNIRNMSVKKLWYYLQYKEVLFFSIILLNIYDIFRCVHPSEIIWFIVSALKLQGVPWINNLLEFTTDVLDIGATHLSFAGLLRWERTLVIFSVAI